ncbi:MAG: twin transmembrane helix small protein [Caulobacteraceae bacterium]
MQARDIFDILVPLSLLAVLITLGFGIYSLYRGGDFARSYSNKIMRLRVVLQFVAILILMAAFYFVRSH